MCICGYGITFDSAGPWSFNNATARNVEICGVDNSSSFQAENCKDNFVVLGEGSASGINRSFGSPKKKYSMNFSEANTKLYLFVC